jgi:hypothetical protein
MPNKKAKRKTPAKRHKATLKRRSKPHEKKLDERFVLSFMPDELKEEAKIMLASNGDYEVAKFWASATRSQLEMLAHNIMWDELLWETRRESIRKAMIEVMHGEYRIEERPEGD